MIGSDIEFEAMYRERLQEMILERRRGVSNTLETEGRQEHQRDRMRLRLWHRLETAAALTLLNWSLRLMRRAKAV